MRGHRLLLPLLGSSVVLACDGHAPTGTFAGAPDFAAAGGAPVVATATGSGHYTANGALRTLAFSAVRRADGTVSGQYQVVIHATDHYFHVAVTCVSVSGNKAWIAGIIEKTNHPVIVEGTVSYFWAVDGGESADAVDVVSLARINDRPGEDQRFCSLMPDESFSGLPGRVVEHGNVQVRGD